MQVRFRQHRHRGHDAVPLDRGFERQHGVAEMRPAAQIHAVDAGGFQPHVPERHPVVELAGVVVQQQVVLQVRRPQQRVLGMRHQARAADRRDRERDQLVHLEARVIAAAVEYRHVGIGQPGIDRGEFRRRALARALRSLAQPGGYAHVHLGLRFQETMQARHQPARGERRRRAHHQHAPALVRAQPLHRLHQVVEPLAQLGQAGLRHVGQFQRAVVPQEQLHPEMLLQRLDLVAHRRGRDVQLECGFFHTQQARGGLESLQGIERGQSAGHMS